MGSRHVQEAIEASSAGSVSRRAALRHLGQGGIAATAFTAGTVDRHSASAHNDTSGIDANDLLVPAVSRDDLPEVSADTTGRLRRLTDYDRGLWLETEAQWLSVRGELFDVRAFGAVGDGATDDWPAFTRAIESMTSKLEADSTSAYGRTLYVPPGSYRLAQTLVIRRSVRLVGASGMGDKTDSMIQVDPGIVGIIIAASEPGVTGQPGRSADGTIIERLRIVSAPPAPGESAEGTSIKETKLDGGQADPKTVHGIRIEARAAVRDTCVEGFAGDGIHVETVIVPTETNEHIAADWEASNCWVAGCGGHGLAVLGAAIGKAQLLHTIDNGGWGISDSSTPGSTFVQCFAAGNGDGPFTSNGGANRSHFISCTAADTDSRSIFGTGTVVVGGSYPGGFGGGNAWTTDAARMTLQAQSPGEGEDRLPTVPTLQLRGAVGQVRAHLRISEPGGARLVEVDGAGRLLIGPADQGATSSGGEEGGMLPVQVQISHAESGQAALRWVVADKGRGDAWVAQARAYRTAGETDTGPERGIARLTFQTQGPGATEIDTLTLSDGRVGIGTSTPAPAALLDMVSTTQGLLPPRLTSEQRDAIETPPEGLTIYNVTFHRLNLHDGEEWREIALS